MIFNIMLSDDQVFQISVLEDLSLLSELVFKCFLPSTLHILENYFDFFPSQQAPLRNSEVVSYAIRYLHDADVHLNANR